MSWQEPYKKKNIISRVLCILFYSVGYLKEVILRVIVFYCVFSIYLGNTETIDLIPKDEPTGFCKLTGILIQSDL
jgi:hypothetical protein